MHEFTAMEHLYQAGGSVPRPIHASENAILMSYVGDEFMAAPTLNTVALERDEAEALFQEVLRNVDLLDNARPTTIPASLPFDPLDWLCHFDQQSDFRYVSEHSPS
jgi:hypothetical protein